MGAEPVSLADAVAARALLAVLEPFLAVVRANSLIWWPFVLSALAVAAAAFWWTHGRDRAALGAFRRRFLGRDIWLHPSAHADYAYFLVNGILFPLIVGPLILTSAAIGGWVQAALVQIFGAPHAPFLGLNSARIVYTVAFFLAYDFGRFAAHSLMHEVPALWEFHKVHHSAEVLTPFTNWRAHPVELFVMGIIPNALTGLVTGAVWYASAGEIGLYTFFGLHAGVFAFNLIGNLRHWQVWLSFGPLLNRWLISPAHHQIHHSRESRHFGKNRGFELAIWDRMFGTLYAPVEEESFALGLGDGTDGAWHSLGRLYIWPFRLVLRRLGSVSESASRGNSA